MRTWHTEFGIRRVEWGKGRPAENESRPYIGYLQVSLPHIDLDFRLYFNELLPILSQISLPWKQVIWR